MLDLESYADEARATLFSAPVRKSRASAERGTDLPPLPPGFKCRTCHRYPKVLEQQIDPVVGAIGLQNRNGIEAEITGEPLSYAGIVI